MNANLRPTMSGLAPAISVSGLLQLLESSGASGTFRLGDLSLRLRAGRVCKASGDPTDVVAALVSAEGEWSFRAARATPSGDLELSVTGLLLEAARRTDEAATRA